MDKFYEYSDNREKCKYDLEIMKSCKECLFQTLCKLEQDKTKKLEKKA